VPYRANIDALNGWAARCDQCCLPAGRSAMKWHRVLSSVEQFIDRTIARKKVVLMAPACVASMSAWHTSTWPALWATRAKTAAASIAGNQCARGGNLSGDGRPAVQHAVAESKMLPRKSGAAIDRMTNMPEAKLAREAELANASVAMITEL